VRITEETFEGSDRPLRLRVFAAGGRCIEDARWTYEDDSRGNWVRKAVDVSRDPEKRSLWRHQFIGLARDIEYAD